MSFIRQTAMLYLHVSGNKIFTLPILYCWSSYNMRHSSTNKFDHELRNRKQKLFGHLIISVVTRKVNVSHLAVALPLAFERPYGFANAHKTCAQIYALERCECMHFSCILCGWLYRTGRWEWRWMWGAATALSVLACKMHSNARNLRQRSPARCFVCVPTGITVRLAVDGFVFGSVKINTMHTVILLALDGGGVALLVRYAIDGIRMFAVARVRVRLRVLMCFIWRAKPACVNYHRYSTFHERHKPVKAARSIEPEW